MPFVWCLSGAVAAAPVDDWPRYGNNLDNHRFSALDQIDRDNVDELQLAWRFETGRKATFQSSPIVVDGVMYLTTPYNDIIALDAASGDPLWRYRHDLKRRKTCCGPANRGPAVDQRHVYSVTIDARLVALDRATGQRVWDVPLEVPEVGDGEQLSAVFGISELDGAVQTGQSGYSANMAPQVFDGKVFAGITGTGYGLHMEVDEGGERRLSVGGISGGHGLRGFIAAFDAANGRELWRWYSVPEEGWEGVLRETTAAGDALNRNIRRERADLGRFAGSWRYGGGSIWTTPAIDAGRGLLFLGTGNPSPQMDDTTRPGDNLYTVSLVALDVHTGELRWHFQQVPHDRWGYDVASPPVLFDVVDKGRRVPAVAQASKTGWVYVHDRRNGRLIRRSAPLVEHHNLFQPPTEDGIRIVPGAIGAVSWSPTALDPATQTLFVAGIHQASDYFRRELEPTAGRPWGSFSFFKATDEPDWGTLSAVALDSGELRWQRRMQRPMVGGVLATAGGLIFTGEGTGRFGAYDTDGGDLLWFFDSPYGVNAPPISYRVGGRQFVAVAAGGNRLFGYPTGDELLVFALPE
ncbi:MAG: PQQ-binding-like beta-propeller repeat protein [Gammaproteobacteria bacterium]|nr:PQQ-binding-like beta-propeller repeat protein [Gammaproteobacteria bacterium]